VLPVPVLLEPELEAPLPEKFSLPLQAASSTTAAAAMIDNLRIVVRPSLDFKSASVQI
jgi:hypothetical protein